MDDTLGVEEVQATCDCQRDIFAPLAPVILVSHLLSLLMQCALKVSALQMDTRTFAAEAFSQGLSLHPLCPGKLYLIVC